VIWRILIGVGIGLAALWFVLVLALVIARPSTGAAREALRILPDTVRLARRLATDQSLPRRIRLRLWLLLGYLAFPLDPIPDFLPVIGYADDAIVAAVVLRSVVRSAGPEIIRARWPGTQAGLATLWRIARLPGDPPDATAQPARG
jgi:uncharacterized membrane protein YkvA (DUF1232 family)